MPRCAHSLRYSFLHFAQPGVYPIFLITSCEIFMFCGTGRSSTGKNGGSSRLNIGRGSIRQCISQNSSGSPRRALDRVQIIQRRLFRHRLQSLDLITPFVHNMFFCMESFSQSRAQVPPLCHDTSWNLPSNSEHHRCTECQEHPSMLKSLSRSYGDLPSLATWHCS